LISDTALGWLHSKGVFLPFITFKIKVYSWVVEEITGDRDEADMYTRHSKVSEKVKWDFLLQKDSLKVKYHSSIPHAAFNNHNHILLPSPPKERSQI
jgi:hypothetical protein